jgi:signal transduction histidine kinase/CheY-like chemotaxis protein
MPRRLLPRLRGLADKQATDPSKSDTNPADDERRSGKHAESKIEAQLRQEIRHLRADLQRLRKAYEHRTRLLARTSHDIRTPLSGIAGFAELLLGTQLDDTQRDHLTTILSSATSLLSTAHDLVDFTKIEAGRLRLHTREFEFRSCVEDVLVLLSTQADDKGLELIGYVEPAVPQFITGDPIRIKQVLINLISNAIKYTGQGAVVVQVARGAAIADLPSLRFEISDTGGGLTEEVQLSLFDAFVDSGKKDPADVNSSGLGLWICKQLVELMGGEIGTETTPGHGSKFWFTLPFRYGKLNQERIRMPSQSVIVFERHPLARRGMAETLENWGLVPLQAANQTDLAKLAEAEPQLIILSLTQADIETGLYQTILRFIAKQFHCPVLALASGANVAVQERLRLDGAAQCLGKPIREKGLLRVVRRMLNIGAQELDRTGSIAMEQPSAEELATVRDLSVLVVEDNAVSRKLIYALLEKLGARISIATDGEAAVQKAIAERFDVILMDIHLPKLDGVEASKAIREKAPDGDKVAIIGLTADLVPEHRERFLQGGLTDILYKPANTTRLWEAITRSMNPRAGQPPRVDDVGAEFSDVAYQAPVIDWTLNLERADGNRYLADELVKTFVTDLPLRITEIQKAFDQSNHAHIATIAHSLTGAATYCGATAFKLVAAELDKAASSGNIDQISNWIAKLSAETDRLIVAYAGSRNS